MLFENYIFSLLPPYFKNTDSYKDGSGKGLLQRYLEALGKEWDLNEKLKLEALLNAYDVSSNPTLLHNISFMFGDFPQSILSDEVFKKLVKNAIHLLKVKGTRLSYEKIFALYNPSIVVTITENFPSVTSRDNPPDRDNPDSKRDSACATCVEYDVEIQYPNTIDETEMENVANLFITIMEPLNAKLGTLTLTTL